MNRSATRNTILATTVVALGASLATGMRGSSLEDVAFGVHATARVAFAFFLAFFLAVYFPIRSACTRV